MFKRGQTATEYLIILAVVIIIGLIVVAALGGIPGIGGGTGGRTLQTQLATAPVGVTSYAITNESIIVTLRNNEQETIVVTNVSLDGHTLSNCAGLPVTLRVGESQDVICPYSGTIDSRYEQEIAIDYNLHGISFSTTPGLLTGTVGSAASGSAPETSVQDPDDVQIIDFISNISGTLDFGGSVNLTWNVENADSCKGSGGWSGDKNRNGGSEVISNLEETTTFNLTCTGDGPDAVETVTVEVEDDPSAGVIEALRSGLIGYWPLDETEGTTAFDHSGNDNHGDIQAGVSLGEQGLLTNSMRFDRTSNSYIEIGKSSYSMGVTNVGTFVGWIKPVATFFVGYSHDLMSDASASGGFSMRAMGDLKAEFYVYKQQRSRQRTDSTPFILNEWNHMVVIMGENEITIWVNGELIEDRSEGEPYPRGSGVLQEGNTLKLGMDGRYRSWHATDGFLNELAIWNRSLSEAEVQDLYNQGNGLSLKLN